MKPTVYLAGPIDGLEYEQAVVWRNRAITNLAMRGIVGVSPMRGKEYLEGELLNAGTEGRPQRQDPLCTDKGIMGRDYYDCMHCDLVLANFFGSKQKSLGTAMECAWRFQAGKPVIAVIEPGNFHDHPMLRETFTYSVPTLGHGLKLAITLLDPYTRR